MEDEQRGIVKVIKEKPYYTANDVMSIMDVSRAKAYRMIKAMRDELVESGKLVGEYPAGRIPRKYFNERCCL